MGSNGGQSADHQVEKESKARTNGGDQFSCGSSLKSGSYHWTYCTSQARHSDFGTFEEIRGQDTNSPSSPHSVFTLYLISPSILKEPFDFKAMVDNPVNKSNIQGGIWPRMPKEFETYLFYKITNVNRFRLDLKDFVGNITTGLECELLLSKIKQGEDAGIPVKIPMSGINVAFTQKGLQKV